MRHYIPVWIAFLFLCFDVQCFLFFFFFENVHWLFLLFNGSQTSFFNKTFIKNGFHDTIHTIKNYFAIVFSVFSKISSIQMDPISQTKSLAQNQFFFFFSLINIQKHNCIHIRYDTIAKQPKNYTKLTIFYAK